MIRLFWKPRNWGRFWRDFHRRWHWLGRDELWCKYLRPASHPQEKAGVCKSNLRAAHGPPVESFLQLGWRVLTGRLSGNFIASQAARTRLKVCTIGLLLFVINFCNVTIKKRRGWLLFKLWPRRSLVPENKFSQLPVDSYLSSMVWIYIRIPSSPILQHGNKRPRMHQSTQGFKP